MHRLLLRSALLAALTPLFVTGVFAQLPPGTILPVQLNSTIDSNHDRAGERITAKLQQEVPLPDRGRIPKGSVISGHIVSVARSSEGNPAKIVFVFDTLAASGRDVGIATDLRALASMLEINTAELPANQNGFDSTVWDWNLRLVGQQVAFGGQRIVKNTAGQVVGRVPEPGAVLGKSQPNPEQGCVTTYDNPYEQAFWVFSTDACGIYGVKNLMLVRPDERPALTNITLSSAKRVLVRGGSGLLLQIVPVK